MALGIMPGKHFLVRSAAVTPDWPACGDKVLFKRDGVTYVMRALALAGDRVG